jgi:hypothetical protein
MKLHLASVALVIATVGCAGRFERQMTSDVNQFVGKDIHVAIAKLGYPGKEETIAGDHIYRWAMNGGGRAMTGAAGPIAVTDMTVYGCSIDLVVDASNMVTRGNWAGDRKSCGNFEDRLED